MSGTSTRDKVSGLSAVFCLSQLCSYYKWGQYYNTFFGVIYATSGVFPHNFDRGYVNSDVIPSKKFRYLGSIKFTVF